MFVHLQGRNNILDTYFYMHATLVLIADHHHSTTLPDMGNIYQAGLRPSQQKARLADMNIR
jgi:hypothetical protein